MSSVDKKGESQEKKAQQFSDFLERNSALSGIPVEPKNGKKDQGAKKIDRKMKVF